MLLLFLIVMLWREVLMALILFVRKACLGDYSGRKGVLCGLGVNILC